MTIKNPVPKLMALILISIVASFLAISADGSLLAKLDSMSAADYVEAQRKVYHHSFIHHYIIWLFIGGFFIASVETLAYLISLLFKKPAV